ncbi:MAG: AI-2E family transporter [Actinobacteria bacterium]|jgi:predicted PurR-regulated permease PerM|nr:MAG: AI-2E family transporter [Actinomycetota bacterium]
MLPEFAPDKSSGVFEWTQGARMPEENEKSGLVGPDKPWLWRWGTSGWLFLGIVGAVVVFGMIYSKTHQILIPLVIAIIIGILLEPFVDFMTRHHIPRWLATLIMLIIIVVVIAGFLAVIVYGISTQASSIGQQVENGANRIQAWLDNLKVSGSFAQWVQQQIEKAWPSITDGIASEVAGSVHGLTSFLIGAFIGFFILMFILADDGTIKEWVAGHMGVPRSTGNIIMNEVYASIRGYFKGTTIIATVDTILVVIVSLILRLPLVGAIGLVSFVTCYIPSFGGYIGGAFAVLIALASKGLTAGIIMLVLVVLIHTVMQNPVQAIAYGKTLKLHPLVALLVTLLGAVFGGIFGAILAVPITAVILKVSRELKRVHREGGGLPACDDASSTTHVGPPPDAGPA